MKTIYQIARSEFRSLFSSPIAWAVLVLFTFQLSMGFTGMVTYTIKNGYLGHDLKSLTSHLYVNGFGQPLFRIAYEYLFLYLPLLTMALMSREYSSGSIKLLFSSPITSRQIILGKYLSMVMYGLVLVAILAVYCVFGLFAVKSLDFKWLLCGMFGMYLLICLYAAIGLFISSLTSYQVVAAIGSIATIMVLQYVGGLLQWVPGVREILNWFGIGGHGIVSGLITTGDILYYVLMSGMFVTFAIMVLYYKRNKRSLSRKILSYAGVVVITGLLGYVTSRPGAMLYWDATRFHQRTITQNSREILEQFPGEMKITSYVNILDSHTAQPALPVSRLKDQSFLGGYRRFKPDIKMEYVYYFDEVDGHGHDCCTGDDLEEEARTDAQVAKLNFRNILHPHQIRELIDLSGESGLVRQIEYEGKKTWLRMYNDLAIYPGEPEITDALQVLLTRQMRVGFLSGHGERELHDVGEKGYAGYWNDGGTRGAHINHGCDIFDVPFKEGHGIPDDLDMLVIADANRPYNEQELIRLREIVDSGLNMTINADVGSLGVMDDLLAMFGVSIVPGMLVEIHEDYSPTLIRGQLTPEVGRISPGLARRVGRQPVTMPGAVGLTYTDDGPFDIVPFIVSNPEVWNELEQNDFEEEPPVFNPEAGEEQGVFVLGLLLTREVNGKQQRIMICGDSDWMNRTEVDTWRGFPAANSVLCSENIWWQTENRYPVDVSRPGLPDNEMKASFESRDLITWGFRFFFPLVWTICGILIWVRRRGK